jgi:hypothetical protein
MGCAAPGKPVIVKAAAASAAAENERATANGDRRRSAIVLPGDAAEAQAPCSMSSETHLPAHASSALSAGSSS